MIEAKLRKAPAAPAAPPFCELATEGPRATPELPPLNPEDEADFEGLLLNYRTLSPASKAKALCYVQGLVAMEDEDSPEFRWFKKNHTFTRRSETRGGANAKEVRILDINSDSPTFSLRVGDPVESLARLSQMLGMSPTAAYQNLNYAKKRVEREGDADPSTPVSATLKGITYCLEEDYQKALLASVHD